MKTPTTGKIIYKCLTIDASHETQPQIILWGEKYIRHFEENNKYIHQILYITTLLTKLTTK